MFWSGTPEADPDNYYFGRYLFLIIVYVYAFV